MLGVSSIYQLQIRGDDSAIAVVSGFGETLIRQDIYLVSVTKSRIHQEPCLELKTKEYS